MNGKSLKKVQAAQKSLCKSQGGATIEGKGGDPHKGHESAPKEYGHGSGKGKKGS